MRKQVRMEDFPCSVQGCNALATAHFVQAEGRTCAALGHLCEEHGARFLYGYWDSQAVCPGSPLRHEKGVAFGPGLVFFHDGRDERGPLTQLILVEVGGVRKLGMGIGRFEGESLALELQHHKARRPVPHQAMVTLIEALGARLLYVVIDRFMPGEKVLYEAKLHIEQARSEVVVDARPSDAVTLAVIRDVPIYVSDAVLATLEPR